MALDTFKPYLFVSAGEQSNKLLTPTYSGGIASFQAQRAQQVTKLLAQINPVQEGTGDPSPENIRPITGRTGMTLTVVGKNLMPRSTIDRTVLGLTAKANADGSVHVTGTASGETSVQIYTNFVLPAGTYIWSSGLDESFQTYDTYLSSNGTIARGNSNSPGPMFTLTETRNVSCNVRVRGGQTVDITVYPMVRVVGTSDTFEPYVGTTYPISWQTEAGTVYGGTLDVVSGVLTVDTAYIALSSVPMSGTAVSDGVRRFYSAVISSVPGYVEVVACDSLKASSSYVYNQLNYASFSGDGRLVVTPSWAQESTSIAEYNTALAENPTYLVVRLAASETYQLDPEEILTLPGYNQIYTDAGPVLDVEF